jgi:small-conductance mechanosensitive channel
MFNYSKLALGLLLLCASSIPTGHAQDSPSPPLSPSTEAQSPETPTAPVLLDGRTLFKVRGTSSNPASERAAAISGRIDALAGNPAVALADLVVLPGQIGLEIRAGNDLLMVLVPADAALEGVRPDVLAESHRQRIERAVAGYRNDREQGELLRDAAASAVATAILVFLLLFNRFLFRKSQAFLDNKVKAQIAAMPQGTLQFIQGKQLQDALAATVRGVHRLILAVLLYLWLEFVLGQFPWTRWISDGLLTFMTDPLLRIGSSVMDYLPSLIFLLVLGLITRYGLRLIKLYFAAVERGRATLANFDSAWSLPTYKLIRTLVIGIALVMAYPYLPGSGSEALRGISVFAGLLLSLGASAAVGNVIAGYFNIFGRVFRVGDVIKVGEVCGAVTQIRLLTTRVRTIKNEEVTLPNSMIVSNHLVNYSALAQTQGLILHTEVGIGYEVPWRQVHALLEEAARRTPDVRLEPAPFILQRSLGDFAVVYQLNVYTNTAQGMAGIYSLLHQHILDVFNEHGVQIMTPAYEGDPQEPKIVPQSKWYDAPAKPPSGTPGPV